MVAEPILQPAAALVKPRGGFVQGINRAAHVCFLPNGSVPLADSRLKGAGIFAELRLPFRLIVLAQHLTLFQLATHALDDLADVNEYGSITDRTKI
jgi:hypothetical protein